jgi:UDP-galactopyranose mutase
VIGAGPAGLTAALRLSEGGMPPVVLEADPVVGGISRTVERDGWRFDIGGHRFFTKVGAVEEMWFDLLPEDMMKRPRMSRIFYDGKFFDYPLRPANAFRNLGPVESVRCVLSYLWPGPPPRRRRLVRELGVGALRPAPLPHVLQDLHREGLGRAGRPDRCRLGAQRIKSLSLGVALRTALGRAPGGAPTTSLIEEFHYPRFGPGMMWEACAERASALGAQILLEHPSRPSPTRGVGRRRSTPTPTRRSPAPTWCPRCRSVSWWPPWIRRRRRASSRPPATCATATS